MYPFLAGYTLQRREGAGSFMRVTLSPHRPLRFPGVTLLVTFPLPLHSSLLGFGEPCWLVLCPFSGVLFCSVVAVVLLSFLVLVFLGALLGNAETCGCGVLSSMRLWARCAQKWVMCWWLNVLSFPAMLHSAAAREQFAVYTILLGGVLTCVFYRPCNFFGVLVGLEEFYDRWDYLVMHLSPRVLG